jgi:hypothetical protein
VRLSNHIRMRKEVRPRLEAWIRTLLTTTQQDGKRQELGLYVGRATSAGGPAGEVYDDLAHHPVSGNEEVVDLVDEILETAQEDAIQRGLPIARFQVRSVTGAKTYFMMSVQEPENTAMNGNGDGFRISGGGGGGGVFDETSNYGIQFLELAITAAREESNALREEVRRLREALEQRDRASLESLKIFEDLLTMQHVRDMEIRRMQKEEERMDKIGEMIKPVFGVAMNRMLGSKVLAEKSSGPLELVRTFMGSLNNEQLSFMGDLLKDRPLLLEAFMQLARDILDMQKEDDPKKWESKILQGIRFVVRGMGPQDLEQLKMAVLNGTLQQQQGLALKEIVESVLKMPDDKP